MDGGLLFDGGRTSCCNSIVVCRNGGGGVGVGVRSDCGQLGTIGIAFAVRHGAFAVDGPGCRVTNVALGGGGGPGFSGAGRNMDVFIRGGGPFDFVNDGFVGGQALFAKARAC